VDTGARALVERFGYDFSLILPLGASSSFLYDGCNPI